MRASVLHPARSPASDSWHHGWSSQLPEHLVESACRRLGVAALMYAAIYAVSYAVGMAFWPAEHWVELTSRPGQQLSLAIATASIVGALGMFAVVRSNVLDADALLNLGLLFWILGAFGIDGAAYVGMLSEGITPLQLSWVCVWLLIFPLLVPGPPTRMLVAALATASTGPASFFLAVRVVGMPAWEQYGLGWTGYLVNLFLPYYLCAVAAFIAARVLYRLGTEVRRAQEMGSYQLERKLGSGGMGEVWLARHRLLARPAAVKLLRPEALGSPGTPSATLRRRFEREARATAELRSVHTVNLYDFGVTDDGAFYYAMELLEGIDLERLVGRFGPQPPERVVAILLQICESLDEAHSKGLLHRDIKPSNVILCRLGRREDVVKVVDFGLVKSFRDAGSGSTRLTQEGMTPGTPAYMAPELALEERDVDGRADLYSVGCLAYWLLTGQLVFSGDTPMQIILRHVSDEPAPPSATTELEVPDALDELVLGCLAKDPADRPQSAEEVARRLRRSGVQPWSREEARAWWRLHEAEILDPGAGGAERRSDEQPVAVARPR